LNKDTDISSTGQKHKDKDKDKDKKKRMNREGGWKGRCFVEKDKRVIDLKRKRNKIV